MSNVDNPNGLLYTKDHEWIRLVEKETAVVGITFFAQDQLGDIVYLDLPITGSQLRQFEKLGEVESVKSVSDLFSPLSGEVLDINEEAINHPELVNSDPYTNGWLVKIRLTNKNELANLLSLEEYESLLSAEGS
jgi:glycine cleavage system H protein